MDREKDQVTSACRAPRRTVRKRREVDYVYLKALETTLTEWLEPGDEEAFSSLSSLSRP